MPIPKPRKDEKRIDFITRCMGDEIMKEEYPSQEQRAAVCYTQWRKKDARESETK